MRWLVKGQSYDVSLEAFIVQLLVQGEIKSLINYKCIF